MPSWRATLGMATGALMVGGAVGWAARSPDAGWTAEQVEETAGSCPSTVATQATALAAEAFGPYRPGDSGTRAQAWLRRTGGRATVDLVEAGLQDDDVAAEGARVQLNFVTDRGWQADRCTIGRRHYPGRP